MAGWRVMSLVAEQTWQKLKLQLGATNRAARRHCLIGKRLFSLIRMLVLAEVPSLL